MRYSQNMPALANQRTDGKNKLFVLLDGASGENTFGAVFSYEGVTDYIPLFHGTRYESAMAHGPVLVETGARTQFFIWFCMEAPQSHSGVVIFSSHSLRELADQYRQFLEARLPDGKTALLRFYDPRITLRAMKLMDEAESALFCDNVSALYVPRKKDGESVYWKDLLEQGANDE